MKNDPESTTLTPDRKEALMRDYEDLRRDCTGYVEQLNQRNLSRPTPYAYRGGRGKMAIEKVRYGLPLHRAAEDYMIGLFADGGLSSEGESYRIAAAMHILSGASWVQPPEGADNPHDVYTDGSPGDDEPGDEEQGE